MQCITDDTTTSGYEHIFSLGYRCSSAGILKSLGLKTVSYPFDWLVSRLPIIEHCVENQFKEFLNPLNYIKKRSATYHYTTNHPNSRQWICDENMVFNAFYEKSNILSTKSIYIPYPLDPENDAYAHQLMMNHHDITTEKDRSYYERCVDRWNQLWSNKHSKKLSLYIHPAMPHDWYNINNANLLTEIRRFHKNTNTHGDGIYIIPVKTEYENPIPYCSKYVLEELEDDSNTPNCRICVLWTNKYFVDAGEIFMGSSGVETYVVREYVQMAVDLGHLPIIAN